MTKERREELIALATESAMGTMLFRENFDSFLNYLADETDEVIDFRFEDLTGEELGIVDELGFECAECGWFCEFGELALDCTEEDNICENCHANHGEEESEDEY